MTDSTFTIQQNTVNGLVSTLDGKASVDLSNSPYTTNRILEIPQDIKLELNNGTLTLKAGSKVYVPNGFEADGTTPKFDVVTIQSDTSVYFAGVGRGQCMVFYQPDANTLGWYIPSECVSGTTQTGAVFYNTSTNTIRFIAENQRASFSLGIIYESNGSGITSIDQIFNGFGYIGSTVFALPGVKGAIPNGRNQDGTCEATLTTLTSVKTRTFTDAVQGGWYLQTNGASSGNPPVYSDIQPSQNYIRWFSQKDNQWYDTHSSPELNSETYILPLALFNTDSTGKITSFEPYNVDSVANSNASNFSQAGRSYLSGFGMPDVNHYDDLTLGASGSSYVAPANGYFAIDRGTVSGNPVEIKAYNSNDVEIYGAATETGGGGRLTLPVKKGTTVKVSYTGTTTLYYFRFIYAVGEN